jgi:hypothetical protein
VLCRLSWWSARVYLRTEFEPERVYEWLPIAGAVKRIAVGKPGVAEWTRTVRVLSG